MTRAGRDGEAAEFSRVFALQPDMGFGADATLFEIEAEPEERAALARRFGLLSLQAFLAKGRIEVFEGGRSARLEGHIVADVVQACVVTLEPVAAHVEDDFSLLYARDAGAGGGGRHAKGAAVDIAAAPEDEDAPEPLAEAGIDVGEAAAECLGLALDPYPRAADAGEALTALSTQEEEEVPASPFAELERLKRK